MLVDYIEIQKLEKKLNDKILPIVQKLEAENLALKAENAIETERAKHYHEKWQDAQYKLNQLAAIFLTVTTQANQSKLDQ